MNVVQRLAILGLALTSLLGVAWGQSTQSPGTPAPAAGLAAPAASASEVAADAVRPAVVAPQVRGLRQELERLIRSPGVQGVLVVSLDRGDTLFAHNADLPLAPASNMKLYSTAAALYYLGPNFRYSTFALADGEIRNGTLHGDVILYGTGDPAISSRLLDGALPALRALADSLRAQGITEVAGDVIGDGSYFDDAWTAPGWRENYRLATYAAPIGALSLAENIVAVRVLPGAAVGQPAQIRTTPRTEGLLIHNRVRTIASGSSAVRFSHEPDGLVIEGQIARAHPGVARTVTVVDPANFAAATFRAVLQDAGIAVRGSVRTIRDPAASPVTSAARRAGHSGEVGGPPRIVASHLSPTLAELVEVTNHVSQNLFAEALLKTVGRVVLGDGSFAGGARAIQYFLECEETVDLSSLRLVDGSGLSPLNRVTPRATVHLLDAMTRTDVWEPFYASLPEAASPQGGQHSLRNRMGQSPAARNLRAKTGTISNVSSLSGYVRASNGELLAFSIFANDVPSTWQAKRIEDAIGVHLAGFDRPTEIEPAPLAMEEADAADGDLPGGVAPEQAEEASETDPQTSEPAAPRTHRVSSGETLEAIARRYGTSVAEIERVNPGLQPRRLQIGQTLTLPN